MVMIMHRDYFNRMTFSIRVSCFGHLMLSCWLPLDFPYLNGFKPRCLLFTMTLHRPDRVRAKTRKPTWKRTARRQRATTHVLMMLLVSKKHLIVIMAIITIVIFLERAWGPFERACRLSCRFPSRRVERYKSW